MRIVFPPARGAAFSRSGRALADPEALKRRWDAFNLAFLLLGGRQAANRFLDAMHPSLAGTPRMRAGASGLGLIEVARVLRREALKAAPPARLP